VRLVVRHVQPSRVQMPLTRPQSFKIRSSIEIDIWCLITDALASNLACRYSRQIPDKSRTGFMPRGSCHGEKGPGVRRTRCSLQTKEVNRATQPIAVLAPHTTLDNKDL
jgi:hypothetical protein